MRGRRTRRAPALGRPSRTLPHRSRGCRTAGPAATNTAPPTAKGAFGNGGCLPPRVAGFDCSRGGRRVGRRACARGATGVSSPSGRPAAGSAPRARGPPLACGSRAGARRSVGSGGAQARASAAIDVLLRRLERAEVVAIEGPFGGSRTCLCEFAGRCRRDVLCGQRLHCAFVLVVETCAQLDHGVGR